MVEESLARLEVLLARTTEGFYFYLQALSNYFKLLDATERPEPLALIAGLLSFVPNFGPIVVMEPTVLVGFMGSPTTALYIVLLYVGVQAVESNLINPLIQKKMIFLPPAMVLIAQVLLGILVGGLGLILATPIITITMVMINMLYVQDVLGAKSSDEESS